MAENNIFNFELCSKFLIKRKADTKHNKKEVGGLLFDEFNGIIHLKNRLCFFNLTDNGFCDKDGSPNENIFKFYRKIASSGVGLIFTGGAYAGLKKTNPKKVYSKIDFSIASFENYLKLTDEVHSTGTKIFFTIKTIYGRADDYNKFLIFNRAVSPKPALSDCRLPCAQISDKLCDKICNEIGKMAEFAVKTKFDGVLIDASLFGLVGEFLSPEINSRPVGYYFENLDLIKKVLEKVSSANKVFPVFLEISSKSFLSEIYGKDAGKIKTISKFKLKNFDEVLAEQLLSLVKLGVDGFVFKFGTFETEFLSTFNEFECENIFKSVYENIDELFKKNSVKNKFGGDVILIYHDNFSSLSSLKEVKNDNFLFDITKLILANENYLLECFDGKEHKACIKCSLCDRAARECNKTLCAINPSLTFFEEPKASSGQKIAVVGAGIAGTWCARELALNGNQVDFFEQKNSLDCVGKALEIFKFNEQIVDFNKWLRSEIKILEKCGKINLFLKQKFDADKINLAGYDAIVIATGLKERFLNISGAVLKNCENLYDALASEEIFDDKNSIVIDAKSEISLSFAIYLLLCGKKVSLILGDISFLKKISNDRLMYFLFALNKLDCKVFVDAKINRIENDFVEIWLNNKLTKNKFNVSILNMLSKFHYKREVKARSLDCDLFIYEPETYSNSKLLYDLVQKNYPGRVYLIGGALSEGNLEDDIKSAFFVSKNI